MLKVSKEKAKAETYPAPPVNPPFMNSDIIPDTSTAEKRAEIYEQKNQTAQKIASFKNTDIDINKIPAKHMLDKSLEDKINTVQNSIKEIYEVLEEIKNY
jgi:hypothetical protein